MNEHVSKKNSHFLFFFFFLITQEPTLDSRPFRIRTKHQSELELQLEF